MTLLSSGSTSKQAFKDAARCSARGIEKPKKETTLIAVFIVDYTNIILQRLSGDKKKHFASLVFGDEQTLREIHKIGSLSHIANQLQPYSDLTAEEVTELVRRIR